MYAIHRRRLRLLLMDWLYVFVKYEGAIVPMAPLYFCLVPGISLSAQ